MAEREGSVALVTGAGSGIGRATALALAREGYSVVVADVSDEGGETLAAECKRDAGECLFVRCDVAEENSVSDLFAEIRGRFGRLDAAFNNAGIEGLQAPTHECTATNFDQVIAVNLRGVWLCMRDEARLMLGHGGGAIVNCSSVAGLIGLPDIPAYVASKHGVIGLTRAAALEYAKANIRVNAICPGAIQTPMLDRYMADTPDGREAMESVEPMGSRTKSPMLPYGCEAKARAS